jgi:predicted Zn-dependent protease
MSFNPPSDIFNDANDNPLGYFNAHFSFDNSVSLTPSAVLLTLNLKVMQGAPSGSLDVFLHLADISTELDVSMASYIDYEADIITINAPLYGDVNGDGRIDSGDVTMLKYYIASSDRVLFREENPTFNLAAARVTGGDDATAADVALLQLWIATPAPDREFLRLGAVPRTKDESALLGDVNGDFVVSAADVTMLRRYIGATDKAAFMRQNSFIFANADMNGDGVVTAADVTLLRRYLTDINSGRAVLVLRKVYVDIDVYPEQTWINHHGASNYDDVVAEMFERVGVPFMSQWNIQMTPTVRLFNNWSICNNASNCNDCRLSTRCSANHHRSAGRAINHARTRYNNLTNRGHLYIVIAGHIICDCDLYASSHRFIEGLANVGSTGAVARGYIPRYPAPVAVGAATEEQNRWATIRTIQHELSHNYGARDRDCNSPACVVVVRGFWNDMFDVPDVWCGNCKNKMFPNISRKLYGRF